MLCATSSRPQHLAVFPRLPFAHLALASVLVTGGLWAQQTDSARVGVRSRSDSSAQRRQAPGRRDTLAAPISPRRAFLYSLAMPGLGQSKLLRPTAGAVYVGFELLGIAMLGKSRYDLSLAKRRVKESLVRSYAVDGQGIPVFDSLGRPVIKDTVINRYGQTGTDQLRSRVKARRLHYEDWVATLAFTHLFSGADAFVAAHLWDLPKRVEFRRLPSGAAVVTARIPFR